MSRRFLMNFPFRNFKQKNQISTTTTHLFTNNVFSWDGVKLPYKTLLRQTSDNTILNSRVEEYGHGLDLEV